MPTLLTLAGRKWNTVTNQFTGGAVVQLAANGTWYELASVASSVGTAWNIQDFTRTGNSLLFYIEAAGIHLRLPYRGILYKSTDQGQTWTDVTPSSGATEYVSIIKQDVAGNLWCVTDERENHTTVDGGPARIYKSNDEGITWTLKKTITDISFGTRYWSVYNLALDPTDANCIVAEGTEMVAWRIRMWRSENGGETWTAAFAPIGLRQEDGEPYRNVSGLFARAMEFASDGSLIYPTRDVQQVNGYIKRSINRGTNFSTVHSWVLAGVSYGRDFEESGGAIYTSTTDVLKKADSSDPTSWTEIADIADGAPFETYFDFAGFHRSIYSGNDEIYLGINQSTVPGEPEEESVYERPTDLSSGWVIHSDWGNHEADLGYILYPHEKGIVGATTLFIPPTPEYPRPEPPESPPVGPEAPIGIAEPGVGIREKKPMRLRRRQRPIPPEEARLPTRVPPFLMGDRIDKRQPPSAISPGPKVEKWLVFGWLIPAVLAGQKTLAFRNWGPIEALSWKRGQLAYAYDIDPGKGGNRLALLRITHTPYKTRLSDLRNSEFVASGLMYAQSMGLRNPLGQQPIEVWNNMKQNDLEVWVVRFRIEQIYDQRAPERSSVSIAS